MLCVVSLSSPIFYFSFFFQLKGNKRKRIRARFFLLSFSFFSPIRVQNSSDLRRRTLSSIHQNMADRALALVPEKRKRSGDGDGDGDGDSALASASASDPSLALVVPATGGPAITKQEYEKRIKDVS